MADYGHEVLFGYFLDPGAGDPAGTLATARLLDELGYDQIGIQDHPYQVRHFDTMSLIAMILAQTERVRVFPDVANLGLRPPAMLAKMAATLDQLSGGRFELGLGSGGFTRAVQAMGGPNWSPGESVQAVKEAIEIIRTFWSGPRSIRYEGEIFQLRGLQPGPLPAHEMEIWVGATKPRMLRLIGQMADGWVPSLSYVPPAVAAEGNAIIDAAAREAGRDPAEIRRLYNIFSGSFADRPSAGGNDDDREIVGPVEHWIDVLTHLAVDHGFSAFILGGFEDPETLRVYAEEIAPAVRERVTAIRSRT